MKTIFIAVLLVLGSFSAQAQTATYQPYPETYGTWMFQQYWADGNGGYVTSYYRALWSGDTTINGTTYLKTYRGGAELWTGPTGEMLYTGAIRQDIANQQLFFVGTDNVEHDISINQFLEVGDTIPNTPALSFALNMNAAYIDNYVTGFYVSEATQELIGSEYHTVYHLEMIVDNNLSSGMYVDYVAGIGAREIQLFEQSSILHCHSISDTMVVGGGGSPDPYEINCLAGIAEKQLLFHLFPNPASNQVSITLSPEIQERVTVEIFDLSGKRVAHRSDYEFGEALDLAALQPGSYLLAFAVNGIPYTYPLQLIR